MADSMQFETPENVQVQYVPAGLGTRFLAWFIDQVFVFLLVIVMAVILIAGGISFASALEDMDVDNIRPDELGAYFVGIMMLVIGFGSFVYFTLSELMMRGQTLGKRASGIRVVKINGFALDPGSILIRNLFRVADNIPLLWIIPVLSRRYQRLGDMVAGTTVVSDEGPEMTDIRAALAERKASDAEFRFSAKSLQRLNETDFEAVERLLDRWRGIPESQRDQLLSKLVGSLVTKLNAEPPPPDRRVRFLEDLFAAELRRQNRALA